MAGESTDGNEREEAEPTPPCGHPSKEGISEMKAPEVPSKEGISEMKAPEVPSLEGCPKGGVGSAIQVRSGMAERRGGIDEACDDGEEKID